MKPHLSKISSALYGLLRVNVQRLNHYQMLIDKSNDMELKLLFLNYAVQSQSFCNVLMRWLGEYKAPPVSLKKNFMQGLYLKIKEALFSSGRISLLHRSEDLERSALNKYHQALNLSFLPMAVMQDLSKQTKELEESFHSLEEIYHQQSKQLQVA